MATEKFAGPVDYAVFAVPQGRGLGDTLRTLHERIATGSIELLDLEFVSRDNLYNPRRLTLNELDLGGFDAAVFEGAASNILDEDDLAVASEPLAGDQVAVVIVFEDRCLASLADQVAAAGGQELFAGGIAIDDLEELLTKTEGEEQ
ncbi:hypothetical protein G7066_04500 [Leucobacter coleopterorum]|uniref:Uncharacterized protein n=1 Tax=Leucobacter coleopterorum TaxID=2714933 RepID=A0ABX6JUW2_9MICO|nr:DUF6325 family protein [Leucobacter coleopterorum]QIM18102.1 hypothetical protein G7066_04500 [Leucobacter coleopterorum]